MSSEIQGLSPREIMFAGRSRFTVLNEASGNRFTYQVNAPKYDRDGNKIDNPEKAEVLMVKFLNGSGYDFIGILNREGHFFYSRKSKIYKNHLAIRGFEWLVTHIDKMPDKVKFYHEGCCLRCARALTVPESILSGLGPECAKKRLT